MTPSQKLLLGAGIKALTGVSRGTSLIFKCPICGADRAYAKRSRSANTIAVRCTACKTAIIDFKEDGT